MRRDLSREATRERRAKTGRPRDGAGDGAVASRRVAIRLTPAEYEAWVVAAGRVGQDPDEWIKILAEQAIRQERSYVRIARREFERGALSAADVVAQYDASTTHAHRLGDCVLLKLNLRRVRPRRNDKKLEDPQDSWLRGFALALSEVYGLLAGGCDETGIRSIARAAGVTLAELRSAGVAALDLRALRRAGVAEGSPRARSARAHR